MNEYWVTYVTTINDKSASICVDTGFSERIPLEDKPVMHSVMVPLIVTTDDGLMAGNEFDRIYAIEEKLISNTEKKDDISYVGRVTESGLCRLHFYSTKQMAFEKFVEASLPGNNYNYKLKSDLDEKWEYYTEVLLPKKNDWHLFNNGQLIEMLNKHGDNLSKPRIVDHWAYFSDVTGRDLFEKSILEKGFITVEKSQLDEANNSDKKYALKFQRVDKIDLYEMTHLNIQLDNLASSHEGTYDGWETGVVLPWWKRIFPRLSGLFRSK